MFCLSRRLLSLHLVAFVLLLALAGCSDPVEGPEIDEGVYTIYSWTLNPSGCASRGESVRDLVGEDYFVVGKSRDADARLVAGTCHSPTACEQLAAYGLTSSLFGLSVFESDDATRSTWESVEIDIDIERWNDTCSATVHRSILSVNEATGRVRLERRLYTDVRYFAGDDENGDPACFVQNEVAEYGDCRALEVIEADPRLAQPQ